MLQFVGGVAKNAIYSLMADPWNYVIRIDEGSRGIEATYDLTLLGKEFIRDQEFSVN